MYGRDGLQELFDVAKTNAVNANDRVVGVELFTSVVLCRMRALHMSVPGFDFSKALEHLSEKGFCMTQSVPSPDASSYCEVDNHVLEISRIAFGFCRSSEMTLFDVFLSLLFWLEKQRPNEFLVLREMFRNQGVSYSTARLSFSEFKKVARGFGADSWRN